jgi:hypothetical protein
MKINLTSTVSDLKTGIRKNFNLETEIYTLKGNVAGENRKIRALVDLNDGQFPIVLDKGQTGQAFINYLVKNFGMHIKILGDSNTEKSYETNSFVADLCSSNINLASSMLTSQIKELYADEDEEGLESLMTSLVRLAERDGRYFWIFYTAKSTIYDCSRTCESDFDYSYDLDCTKFNVLDYTLYFDPIAEVIGPFTSGRDFNWSADKGGESAYFEELVLQRLKITEDELDRPEEFVQASHAAFTFLICSLVTWINNNEVSEIDLANCFLSVMDPKGQSENMAQLCCDLPSLLCTSIAFIDLTEYNSEEDSSNEPFGDYVHDWLKISDRILAEDTFYA